ncbi:MAG TPA: SDR family NAD(P)-dependent oxidoreductase, partial [Steroidobacteraceae bacterium]
MEIGDFSMDFFSLAGRKAIVTGGNTGLGQAFTLALAKAGADVFVPSVTDDDGNTGAMVRTAGRRYEYLKIDLTAPGSAARVIERCVERLDGLDIL